MKYIALTIGPIYKTLKNAKKPKELLRAVRKYVPSDHMVRSLSFFDVLKRAFKK